MSESQPETSAVIIVGAGPAGLATAGVLRAANVPFIVLESSGEVGSSWQQHYDRLHLHTAARFSALPGLPFPASYGRYPSRQQVYDYLDAYARQFHIEPRFGQTVTAIRREGEQWAVQTSGTTYHAPHVVIATGMNRQPNRPQWPGQDRYRGQIMHSSAYKNGEPLRGKTVLVVGFGNSGAEIAVDLVEHGAQPSMAVRGPVNVISRDVLGIPAQVLSILLMPLPIWTRDALMGPITRLRFGDLQPYGLSKLPYGPVEQITTKARIPVMDIGTIDLIKQRRITVYPGIEQFTERGVTFVGGKSADFDAVVLATGFRTALGNMLPEGYKLLDDNSNPLVSGGATDAPGLYFVGFETLPIGALRTIAIEAQRVARIIGEKL